MGFKACVLDVDGVLILGGSGIPGAPDALKAIRGRGMKLRLITNNSTKSRRALKRHLSELGLPVEEGEIITSASGTANYLRERFGSGKVYVIGEEGLHEELKGAGFESTTDERAEFVVVGLDRHFNYKKLSGALNAIRNGARFIATNDDATLPVENGATPGAGAMVASLVWSSQKKPEAVIGKPNLFLFEQALKELGAMAGETVVVGDRVETDILGANDLGMYSVLVMTGATTKEILEKAPQDYRPKLVLDSIAELPGKLD